MGGGGIHTPDCGSGRNIVPHACARNRRTGRFTSSLGFVLRAGTAPSRCGKKRKTGQCHDARPLDSCQPRQCRRRRASIGACVGNHHPTSICQAGNAGLRGTLSPDNGSCLPCKANPRRARRNIPNNCFGGRLRTDAEKLPLGIEAIDRNLLAFRRFPGATDCRHIRGAAFKQTTFGGSRLAIQQLGRKERRNPAHAGDSA